MNQRTFPLPEGPLAAAKLKAAPTHASEKNGVLHDVSDATHAAITKGLINGRSFPDHLKEKMETCTSPKEFHDLRVLHEAVLVVAQQWKKGNNVSYDKVVAQAQRFGLGESVFLFIREVSKNRKHERALEIAQLEDVRTVADAQESLVEERHNSPEAKKLRKERKAERAIMLEVDLRGLLTEVGALLLIDAQKRWRANTSRWKFWATFPAQKEQTKIAQTLQDWLREHRTGKDVTNSLVAEEVFALRTQKHALLGLAAPEKPAYLSEAEAFDDVVLEEDPTTDALDDFVDDFNLDTEKTTHVPSVTAPSHEMTAEIADTTVEEVQVPHLEAEEVVDAPETVATPHLDVVESEQTVEPALVQEIALETPVQVDPLNTFLSNDAPASNGTLHVPNFEVGADVHFEPKQNQEVRRTNLDGTTQRVPKRMDGATDYSWTSPRRAARDASSSLVASLALDGKVRSQADAYFTAAMESEDGIASAPEAQPMAELVGMEKEVVQEPEPIEYAVPYSGSITLAHATAGAVVAETTMPVVNERLTGSMTTADIQSTPRTERTSFPGPSFTDVQNALNDTLLYPTRRSKEAAPIAGSPIASAEEAPISAPTQGEFDALVAQLTAEEEARAVQSLSVPFSTELLQADILQTLLAEGRPLDVEMIVEDGQMAARVQIQEYNAQSNHVIMDIPGHGLMAKDLVTLRRLNTHYPLAVVPAATPVATVNNHTMRVGMAISDAIRNPVTRPEKKQEPLLLGYDKAPMPSGDYEEFNAPAVAAEQVTTTKAAVAPTTEPEPAKLKKAPIDFTASGLPSAEGILARSNIFKPSNELFTLSELQLLIGRRGQYIDGLIGGKKTRMTVLGVDADGKVSLSCYFEDQSTPGPRTLHINELRQANALPPIELQPGTLRTPRRIGLPAPVPFNTRAFLSSLLAHLGSTQGDEAEQAFLHSQMMGLEQAVWRAMQTTDTPETLRSALQTAVEQHDEEFSEGFDQAWVAGMTIAEEKRTVEPLIPKQSQRKQAPRRISKAFGKLLSLVGF